MPAMQSRKKIAAFDSAYTRFMQALPPMRSFDLACRLKLEA
jgi:hypothetical protein